MRHVVAAVADEGQPPAGQGPERLLEGQQVGEHLRGVPLVGEAVVDGDAGPLRQRLDRVLPESPELDGVEHAPEHPGRVLDRLLGAEVDVLLREEHGVAALLAEGGLEGAAGAGGPLLEQQRQGASPQALRTRPARRSRFTRRDRSSTDRISAVLKSFSVRRLLPFRSTAIASSFPSGSRAGRDAWSRPASTGRAASGLSMRMIRVRSTGVATITRSHGTRSMVSLEVAHLLVAVAHGRQQATDAGVAGEGVADLPGRPGPGIDDLGRTVRPGQHDARAVGHALVRNMRYDEELKQKFIAALDQDLYERHSSFAGVPLLCTIMLITYSETWSINPRLSRFYQDAYNALFDAHDLRKGGFRRKRHTSLDKEQFFDLFAFFCLFSYVQTRFSFSEGDLRKMITHSSQVTKISCEADYYLSDCVSNVCLLIRDGTTYTFTHRSFQEYFSAAFIARLPTDRATEILDLVAARFDQDLVIKLACEINPALVEDKWIGFYLAELEEYYHKQDRDREFRLLDRIFSLKMTTGKKRTLVGYTEPDGRIMAVLASLWSVTEISAARSNIEETLGQYVSKATAREIALIKNFQSCMQLNDSNSSNAQLAFEELSKIASRVAAFLRLSRTVLRSRYEPLSIELERIVAKLQTKFGTNSTGDE